MLSTFPSKYFSNQLAYILRSFAAIACLMMLSHTPFAYAQSEDTVTLYYEDGDAISGQLVDFSPDVLKIQTRMGRLTIPTDGIICIGKACADEIRFVPLSPQVTLEAPNGRLKVTGNLLSVTDGEYIVATQVGELRLKVDGVSCTGKGCPDSEGALPDDREVILTDGTDVIKGKLLGFQEQAYIIDIAIKGIIRVNSDTYNCAGASCP